MKKKLAIAALAAATMMTLCMSLFADSTGWRQNSTGWWYATNDAGTTWHANGWQWLDGNKDGIAECYYFNSDGYCLANTTTPDGYTVNADGAWTVNGVVQTQQVNTVNSDTTGSGGSSASGSGSTSSGTSTSAKYLGTYKCTDYTRDSISPVAIEKDFEFTILEDGSLYNNIKWQSYYSKAASRVSDTKWSNTSGNITRNWEILDNGKKIRYYSTIAGKANGDVTFTRVD